MITEDAHADGHCLAVGTSGSNEVRREEIIMNKLGNSSWDSDPFYGIGENLSPEEKAFWLSNPDLVDALYADFVANVHCDYYDDGYPFLRCLFARFTRERLWSTLCAKKAGSGTMETTYFDMSDPLYAEKMMAVANSYVPKRYDVYFSTCLARTEKDRGRIKQEDVALIPAVFLDVDTLLDETKKGKNLPSSPDVAYAELMNLRSSPTIVICSGYGVHAYWVLSEPIRINGPDDLQKEKLFMREWAEYIASELGYDDIDVHASEPARLLRLPNTENYKRGREAAVYEYPDRTDI
ncbi:hypothetical protein LJC74_05225 [Eubacteriales bacterium OttesenSCG-928-A19]|nr:hypothetical protein [Eubacteriales bacterium OttesenSCG-928-A19]